MTKNDIDFLIRKADEELFTAIQHWANRLKAGQSCEPVWDAIAVSAWLREQRKKFR